MKKKETFLVHHTVYPNFETYRKNEIKQENEVLDCTHTTGLHLYYF